MGVCFHFSQGALRSGGCWVTWVGFYRPSSETAEILSDLAVGGFRFPHSCQTFQLCCSSAVLRRALCVQCPSPWGLGVYIITTRKHLLWGSVRSDFTHFAAGLFVTLLSWEKSLPALLQIEFVDFFFQSVPSSWLTSNLNSFFNCKIQCCVFKLYLQSYTIIITFSLRNFITSSISKKKSHPSQSSLSLPSPHS